MAAITRRAMLAGLSAIAALRPDRALAAWPERNITLMHGLAPGGGVDVSARLIAEGLSRRLGQQVVVEPKPGAGRHAAGGADRPRHARRLYARLYPKRLRGDRRHVQVAALQADSTTSPSSARSRNSRSCS